MRVCRLGSANGEANAYRCDASAECLRSRTIAGVVEKLVRFGVAMDSELLEAFDEVVEQRGGSRSEAVRDLARAEVARAKQRQGAHAIGTLTIVYNHNVRELTERLTAMQHALGHAVHSTLHIHLDRDRCLEVIVMQGRADRLHEIASQMIASRGVTHGELSLVEGAIGHDHHEGAKARKR